MMVITTKKVRRCRCWAYRETGRKYRMQCQREAGHEGNHIVIDGTTSWGLAKTDTEEAKVARLTNRLMRAFDKKHHRFLVDYGWEHVARVALKDPSVRIRPYEHEDAP